MNVLSPKIFAVGSIGCGGILTALRLFQYLNSYEPQTGLMTSGPPSSVLYFFTGICAVAAVVMIFRSRKMEDSSFENFRFSNFTYVLTLLLTLSFIFLTTLSVVYPIEGLNPITRVIYTICPILFVLYGAGFLTFIKTKGNTRGFDVMAIFPVLSLVLFLVSLYVPMSEMNVLDNYVFTILSLVGLILYFSFMAKALCFEEGIGKTAAAGFFSVCMLMAQCIPFIVLIGKDHSFFNPFPFSSCAGIVLILFVLFSTYDLLKTGK